MCGKGVLNLKWKRVGVIDGEIGDDGTGESIDERNEKSVKGD